MTTLDLFNVGTDAPWTIELELRDCRDYTRNYYIVPLTEELAKQAGICGDLFTRIDYHLLDTPYKLKSFYGPKRR